MSHKANSKQFLSDNSLYVLQCTQWSILVLYTVSSISSMPWDVEVQLQVQGNNGNYDTEFTVHKYQWSSK